jgi:biotin/methionine sulfoxide reductase
MSAPREFTHSSHWGGFTVRVRDGEIEAVHPLHDPDPSPLLANLPGSLRHPMRIARPVARRGWLERGPGPTRERGCDSFVELSWDEALDRAAAELSASSRARQPGDLRRLLRVGEPACSTRARASSTGS